MTIKELMSANIYFIKDDTPISDAVDLMKKYNIGFVPVCDNKGFLLGLLTDRDIVLRALGPNLPPLTQIPASKIMSTQIATISSDMNIHDAALIFSKKKVHRLPVIENSRLVGILSLSDLARKKIFLAEVGEIVGSISKNETKTSNFL